MKERESRYRANTEEHRGSFCSPIPSVLHTEVGRGRMEREGGREARGRGGRRMRTRPDQAEGGGRLGGEGGGAV